MTGPPLEDQRVLILFERVGRIAASLRAGRWDDPSAPTEAFALQDLLSVIQSFHSLPVYGDLFDVHDQELAQWGPRASIDSSFPNGSCRHSISLFQDGMTRHLDLVIWFESLTIYRPDRSPVEIADFIAAGARWWSALQHRDHRTEGRGIFPIRGE